MDPLTGITLGLQGFSALSGLIGGAAARRRALAARNLAIQDMAAQLAQDEQDRIARNRRGLLAATGTGGDALTALGSNMGASLANAGVYNSSATAGALAKANADIGAGLTGLAAENNYNEKSLHGANQRYLTGLKTNIASQDLENARMQEQGGYASFGNFINSLPSLFPSQSPSSPQYSPGMQSGIDQAYNTNYAQNAPGVNIPTPGIPAIPSFGSPGRSISPGGVQSAIQGITSSFRPISTNSYGYAMNGNANGTLPGLPSFRKKGLVQPSMPSF